MIFTVPGPAVPWQRVASGHVPTRTRAYKRHVALHALAARQACASWSQDHAAYSVQIAVYRPQAKGRARPGDLDNISKSVLDALSGVLYRDDALVSELLVHLHHCAAGRERIMVVVSAHWIESEVR
jgi:Holliday junction resolvase RusA-like endonuclease